MNSQTISLSGALITAQQKAIQLYDAIIERQLVQPGMTEQALNHQIHALAEACFGVEKYWHKRIVRAGQNTVRPYRENPPNLTLQADDIVFFDFGPVFETYEADVGRTMVLGNDPLKLKLQADLETCFLEGKVHYLAHPEMTGRDFYHHIQTLANGLGWQLSRQGHCGHIIGEFPHEMGIQDHPTAYICPENPLPLNRRDTEGKPLYWILELHLVNADETYGGFYEDLLNL